MGEGKAPADLKSCAPAAADLCPVEIIAVSELCGLRCPDYKALCDVHPMVLYHTQNRREGFRK
jgi:hypothetical protein